MGISYKGAQITGNSGEYYYQDGKKRFGPFKHYSEVEAHMDRRDNYAFARFEAAENLYR